VNRKLKECEMILMQKLFKVYLASVAMLVLTMNLEAGTLKSY